MTKSRKSRHIPEQIVKKFRDADAMLNAGKELAAVLQALEVSDGTCRSNRLPTNVTHNQNLLLDQA